MRLLATTYSFGEVLLTILEVAVLLVWIRVAITVIADVFKSDDLSGAAKAGWILLIVLVPLVGVLCYVLVRGDKMKEHEAAA
jgi:Phospholipase_D-nuclease N-terminal